MKCRICGKVFSSNFCLKLHQRIHDRHGTQPEIIFAAKAGKTKAISKDVNPEPAPERGDTGNTTVQKTEEPGTICKTCHKKFQDAESLSLHMKFHGLFGMFKKAPEPKKSQQLPMASAGSGTAQAENQLTRKGEVQFSITFSAQYFFTFCIICI